MQIDLTYGNNTQPILIPDQNLIAVLRPNDCRPFHDTEAALTRLTETCSAFLGDSQRVLALVNDYTRPTPNAPILAALQPALRARDTRVLVCAGTHRPPSDAEYKTILGPDFLNSSLLTPHSSLTCHDAKDKSRLFFLGKTRFGTDVWLNRELLWADKVIAINSIEPHYFAGYTGGRKSFLPGIAGYDTVTQNHHLVTREGSAPFSLKGNPVHEDMTEAAKMVPRPVFSIQVVQDRHDNLLSIRSGDLFTSFDEAASDAHTVYAVPVEEKADIVLSVLGPPCNINFYQAQRAVEFARPVLKHPSIHITVSACYDGVGNDSFIQVFRACKSPSDLLSPVHHSSLITQHSPVLGWHKSARLAQIMQTADLYTVMGVADPVVRSTFMHPFKSAQAALDAAFAKLGQDARAYVIPDAGSVVPVLRQRTWG